MVVIGYEELCQWVTLFDGLRLTSRNRFRRRKRYSHKALHKTAKPEICPRTVCFEPDIIRSALHLILREGRPRREHVLTSEHVRSVQQLSFRALFSERLVFEGADFFLPFSAFFCPLLTPPFSASPRESKKRV